VEPNRQAPLSEATGPTALPTLAFSRWSASAVSIARSTPEPVMCWSPIVPPDFSRHPRCCWSAWSGSRRHLRV